MGFSASSTSNPQTTTNYQLTGSGSSGNASPTAVAGGSVLITDAGQTGKAIDAVTQISLSALDSSLGLLSDFNARSAQAQVDSSKANTDLLSSVLANNQELANNVQSGGATVGMTLTTKIVWGVLALAAAVVAFVMFKK